MKMERVVDGEAIRERFYDSFLLSWKEFKAENNDLVKLMTAGGFSLSREEIPRYELIAISKEVSFSSAIKRLKEKEGDVYFMSEPKSFPECEGVVGDGVSVKGEVFKCNSASLGEAVEKEWEETENGEDGKRVFPLTLYVFDDKMKKAFVFTPEIVTYEEENEDGELIEIESRLCLSCKRRGGIK